MIEIPNNWQSKDTTQLDFIIVGGGAAGCPLAARLAERGYTVLLIEMGQEDPVSDPNSIAENTEVPLLHPESTEDPRHVLNYFVNQRGESTGDDTGVFYPRAQGLGGCSIHNAMITICGPNEDWDEIAEIMGDPSWRAENMRSYFERLENCTYSTPRTRWERLKALIGLPTGWEQSRHGQAGWLTTSLSDSAFLKRDKSMLKVVLEAANASLRSGMDQLSSWTRSIIGGSPRPNLDPNHWQSMQSHRAGIVQIPCAIDERGKRSSPRARLMQARATCGDRLMICSGALVTNLELEGKQAIGVRLLPKPHAYQADPKAERLQDGWEKQLKACFCKREVVLCAGTFNTPQLLMLSGIGDPDHLGQVATEEQESAKPTDSGSHEGIKVVHGLSGVGRNLQDRYEVGVVSTLKKRLQSLDGVELTSKRPTAENDPELQKWLAFASSSAGTLPGIYSTNGGLIGIFMRSQQEDEIPDLFIMALAAKFTGYRPGWSKPEELIPEREGWPEGKPQEHRTITWVLLKARARNRSGYVRLRSKDPTRRPEINFRSFDTSDQNAAGTYADLKAMEEGVEFIQSMLLEGINEGEIERVELSGRKDGQSVQDWIRETAWGHHACGTCRIGLQDDEFAVVDSRFRVHGIKGLRIVDASIFPRIPGYFIASSIYMIAEKAADVLTEDNFIEFTPAVGSPPVIKSRDATPYQRAFPAELEAAEAALIRQRRKAAGL